MLIDKNLLFLTLFLGFGLFVTNFSYVVVSKSMTPTMPIGSLLYVAPSKTYRSGDIVVFKNKLNQVVTHRILDTDGQYMITKGDANERSDDEIINKNQVIGRAFFAVPYIGEFILMMKNIAS